MWNSWSLLFLFTSLLTFGQISKTEIIVIGNIHQPVPNFNSDTLLTILERLRPNVILHEMDSYFFTADFKFRFPSDENEQNASENYLKMHPKTKLRPFDFEGRNEFRKKKGMRPTDNLTIKMLDSLYRNNQLSEAQNMIMAKYDSLTDVLKIIASKAPREFNNSTTDSIARERQYYQYKKFAEITNARDEFANAYFTKPDGNKISYREGFQLWADFEDLRNRIMAKNIMNVANNNKRSKIVVLTGFLHRYYILSELDKLSNDKNILIKEFYEE